MQSLLSRVGQAHRCGCRTCSTALDALGKRATATARRRPTFAEVFTACYSSVFATAALVDAVRKDDRRKELDRQLEEARRELADLQERGPSNSSSDADPKSPDLSIQQMDSLWRSMKLIYKNRPFMKEIDKPATISASDLVDSLKREYYNCTGEASLIAARRTDYGRLERAIIAEESGTLISYRQPQNQIQLLRESLSTENLVRKLLDRTVFYEDGSPSPSFDEARGMLEDTGYPGFTFRSMNPERAQKNTAMLNRRLRTLIDASDLSLKERVGRVCYNLLVSPHPPDMHTYNTLIVAFDKSGYHAFADALVYSFFHDRLLQPTSSTFVAILNHYKCTNNHGKFLRAMACITGVDSRTGGKVNRRHVSDVEQNPVLHPWAADTKRRTWTGNWIWEHVPLNQALVEEVMGGLLHFKLFDQAASFFVSCMRSGVGLSMKTIKRLLDECIDALDWRAAVRLIRGVTNSQAKWQSMLLAADAESTSYIAGRIRVLIDICGLNTPGWPLPGFILINLDISNAKFARLLENLEKMAPPREQDSLDAGDDGIGRSKSRALQAESLWKEYDFVRKTTCSIESKLLSLDPSPKFRVSMALHIGDAATQRSLQLNQEFTELLSSSSRLRHKPSSQLLLEQCKKFERSMRLSSDSQESPEEGTTAEESTSAQARNLEESGSGKAPESRLESGSRPRHASSTTATMPNWPASGEQAAAAALM